MRNVIVTGGSRGIGLGIARELAATGFRVLAIARKDTPQLIDAINQAEQTKSGAIHFAPFDLSELEAIPNLIKSLRKTHGPIFGLVNNAGISFEGILTMIQDAQIAQLVRMNTVSPILLAKYAVRAMMTDGGGRIVNIASITGLTGFSGLSVYGATKASLIGFTRSLAREVGPMRINVNAVAPGFIDTDMTSSLKPEDRERLVRRSALKRLGTVDDIAGTVAFLLSEKAANITGTVITVDAGSVA